MDLYLNRQINYYANNYKPIDPLYLRDGTLSPLQRWNNSVIDLDKIFQITDAYHINRMGHGGHFVGFDIVGIDAGSNITLNWEIGTSYETITEEEYQSSPHYPNSKIGNSCHRRTYHIEDAVKMCQDVIVNDLVKTWRKYKEKVKV